MTLPVYKAYITSAWGTKQHNDKHQLVESKSWISTGHFPKRPQKHYQLSQLTHFDYIFVICFARFISSLIIQILMVLDHSATAASY
jgi:hypothetical protein